MKKLIILSMVTVGIIHASYYTNQEKIINNCIEKNIPKVIEQASEGNNFYMIVEKTNKFLEDYCKEEFTKYKNKISLGLNYQYGTNKEKQEAKNKIPFKEQEILDNLPKENKENFSNKLNKWETKLITLTIIAKELGKYNDKHKINISNTHEDILLLNKCLSNNKNVINFLSKNQKTLNGKITKIEEMSKKFCPISYREYKYQWLISNEGTLSDIFNNRENLSEDQILLLKKYIPTQIILFSIK